MSCVHCEHPTNTRARLGAEIVQLRERITELEKLARKTPPKTLLVEVERVKRAKAELERVRERLESAEYEYEQAHMLEQERW